jgi:endonuclease/exonuclease/phosphatase family metal-dependent hydrolase
MELHVLTYNIFVRPPGVRSNGCNDWKTERLLDFLTAAHAGRFDVICLQEMFGFASRRRTVAIERAKLLGFSYHAFPSTSMRHLLKGKIIDSGLLVLSRYPIVSSRTCVYDHGCDVDALTNKGALHVTVDVHGRMVDFITTHLQASYVHKSEAQNAKSVQVRQNQVAQLRQMIDQCPNSHCLVLGDLNVDGHDASEYEDMCQGLFDNMMYRDVYLAHHGRHHVTVGDTVEEPDMNASIVADPHELDEPESGNQLVNQTQFDNQKRKQQTSSKYRETVLTSSADWGCRKALDYIFSVSKQADVENVAAIEPVSAAVEYFFVQDRPYTQLSDHYGISAVFRLSQDKSSNGPHQRSNSTILNADSIYNNMIH